MYIFCSKDSEHKQQAQAVTELDKQGSKGALTAVYRHENENTIKPGKFIQIVQTRRNRLKQHKKLRTFGKTAKINIEEVSTLS